MTSFFFLLFQTISKCNLKFLYLVTCGFFFWYLQGFGCPGLSITGSAIATAEIARVDASCSTFILVHSSLAMLTIGNFLLKLCKFSACGVGCITQIQSKTDLCATIYHQNCYFLQGTSLHCLDLVPLFFHFIAYMVPTIFFFLFWCSSMWIRGTKREVLAIIS